MPLDHRRPRPRSPAAGSGFTTPLRISRSRARVAATWKSRRPSSASRASPSSSSSRVVVEVDRGAPEPPHCSPTRGGSLAAQGQERPAPAGQQAAGEVGHGDDVELEPLGVVDGHDPHPVVALGGGRGLGLGVGLGARGEEVEQAAQVAALARLELGGQARELAHVGEARLARRAAAASPGRSRSRSPPPRSAPASERRGARAAAPPSVASRSRASSARSAAGISRPRRSGSASSASPARRQLLQRRPDVAAAARPPRAAARACPGRPRRRARRARRTALRRRAGWRSSPAARRRRRPAAGTSSRARRPRRGAGRPAPASPRRRRGG